MFATCSTSPHLLGTAARREAHRNAPDLLDPRGSAAGKTLRRRRTAFLAYFDADSASDGGTEAVDGIIDLGRRIARGFRDFEHQRLRMLLVTRGFDASPHTQL